MFLGEKITAEQAHSIGQINRVVEDDQFMDEVGSLARRLADSPDMALGLMKKLVNRCILSDINETLELEEFAQGLLFESKNFKEGVDAFFEKR
ncbi:enoyl-CoA hydratase/carnithine racemase [Neobacillus niacini]|nr:enoyl-CoA hydratase/carnithine racemase [Neobacillus niacini]